jgi:hypothetical protein
MPTRVDPETDKRGAPKGAQGQPRHVRTKEAADLIQRLAGYGMPQAEIARSCNAAFPGVGFSIDTLDRHYREELDHGLAVAKEQLLQRAHRMAMMEDIPEGVSKDAAYRISADKVDFLLNVVHRVRPGSVHEFDGSAININITGDDAEL